jgi:hypothetical protein
LKFHLVTQANKNLRVMSRAVNLFAKVKALPVRSTERLCYGGGSVKASGNPLTSPMVVDSTTPSLR